MTNLENMALPVNQKEKATQINLFEETLEMKNEVSQLHIQNALLSS